MAKKDSFADQTRRDGDCLLWTGPAFGEKGYGVYREGEIRMLAHRAAFIKEAGYVPKGRVLQTCKNKRCVEFSHLRDEDGVE